VIRDGGAGLTKLFAVVKLTPGGKVGGLGPLIFRIVDSYLKTCLKCCRLSEDSEDQSKNWVPDSLAFLLEVGGDYKSSAKYGIYNRRLAMELATLHSAPAGGRERSKVGAD